ncbi:hypothetical protein BCD64_20600 [Nostoc sp. MBR 210]|nr:hypothetical protein BCD64_20600 [Nostoc sp. MBR 210]
MLSTEYFIFVDLYNPLTRHNLEHTRQILSTAYYAATSEHLFAEQYLSGQANYLPYLINDQRSTGFLSFYCNSATASYRVDYDAEITRLRHFPTLPSRLSCIYAFATQEDCIKANRLYGWDLKTVRRFTLLQDPLTRIMKVNMEIISLMRSAYSLTMWSPEYIENIWIHYWSGKGNLDIEVPTLQAPPNSHQRVSSGEIWEYLIEGRLHLQGDLYTPIF